MTLPFFCNTSWITRELAALPSDAVAVATTTVNATLLTFDETLRVQIEALVGSTCNTPGDSEASSSVPSSSSELTKTASELSDDEQSQACNAQSDYPQWVTEEIAAFQRPWDTVRVPSAVGTKYRARRWHGSDTGGARQRRSRRGDSRGRVVLAVPHESMCAGSLIRRIASLYYLLQGWKRQLAPIRQALALARLRAIVKLAKHFVTLRTRVRNMDVQAFNSGVINFKLDLLKFAAPRPPTQDAIQVVRQCLRGWVCRRRYHQHRTGIRVYPLQRVRYPRGTSGFTWVNPKHKARWGRLLAMRSTLPSRVRNKPARGHGPPQHNDWVHCMLTGRYVLSAAAEKRHPQHAKRLAYRATKYRRCVEQRDWFGVAKSSWKYEYRTYQTAQFYHDYHMGDILDGTTMRPICQATRPRRDASEAYRIMYLRNIEYYEKKMANRRR